MKESTLYKIIRPLVKGFTCLYFNPKFINCDNIPKNGKVILAGTHSNNFDCIMLMSSTKRSIHFLAKDELWKGMKGILFSNLGLIPVNRRQKDKSVIPAASKYLNSDKLIGIFPEGTFEKEKGVLLPFKIGTVKLAHDTKSQVVPFVIKGNYKFRSKDLRIIFGKPYYIKTDDLEKENQKLMKIITKLLKEN